MGSGEPAGTALPLFVEYRSTREGFVDIYIFRDDLAETVFHRSAYLAVGERMRWRDSVTFPGGRRLYWLYARGADFVYSSPVFVSEN